MSRSSSRPDGPCRLILALFLTNCAEAVLSAGTVWLLSDAPPRFDTPRRLSTFFLAVVGATAISGFLDAAAVTWFLGEPYWTVWSQRLFSNILAQLTIVPALVGVATGLAAVGAHSRRGCGLARRQPSGSA